MLSGDTNDSINAPLAGEPETQSKTFPAIFVRGIVGPVEKKVVAPVFRTLPRMSASPLCMMTVYAVFARQPCAGLTPTASRCQDASGAPSRGEIRNRSDREVAAGDRSDTTSSNRKSTSFGL